MSDIFKAKWKLCRFPVVSLVAVTCVLGSLVAANAFEINTGNPDLFLAWGNNIRYNLGMRIQSMDHKIGNTASSDEGDYKFDKSGDLVTNRLDLLSELDFSYKKKLGIRVSGAVWADVAYNDNAKTNPSLADRGSYSGGKYNSYTKRYYIGPSGELLDANVWGSFDLGDMPVNVAIGRQTVLWGETVVLSAHSVSYAQAPTDVVKALSTPGVDAKEVSMPITQIAGKIQLTPELSVAGQYYLEWRGSRFPEGGTYLAATDFILNGPDRFSLAPGVFLRREGAVKPDTYGDFGLSARWSPQWLDGTLGLYYRMFDETSPWVSLNPGAGSYRAVYAKNAHLVGISFSKQLLGFSFGSEFSYRHNTALNSSIANGSLEGARGDTVHILANAIGSFGHTPLWTNSSVIAEFAFSKYLRVTDNENLFNACYKKAPGKDSAAYGCVTDENMVGYLKFTPAWTAFAEGWDLEMPMSVSYGLFGNGATMGGGNEGAGSYGVGFNAIYNTLHTFSLAYNGYLATYKDNGSTITASNGSQLQDRGWLSFTYKYAF
ncbi:protein of unknown function DUF1302 [Geobacter metallireducens GS-15]|uniref:DUF1302 domain-containing protein n=1 Tax=Geobacter metallireducens (strain ATCC 53774 / DSM 7210 / GS-15) TaxID=269799 RepID=Q39TE9_GEOMG|nr:DUF1302 family protein [Geobacter metallireducens]ABB32475.1 protein of unknown function DUF1302 [Geobacter metallireducens GS-15]